MIRGLGASQVALVVKNLPGMQETCRRHGFNHWVGKLPWSRKYQPIPVLLTGKFHGERSLAAYRPWGCKESAKTEWPHTKKATEPLPHPHCKDYRLTLASFPLFDNYKFPHCLQHLSSRAQVTFYSYSCSVLSTDLFMSYSLGPLLIILVIKKRKKYNSRHFIPGAKSVTPLRQPAKSRVGKVSLSPPSIPASKIWVTQNALLFPSGFLGLLGFCWLGFCFSFYLECH